MWEITLSRYMDENKVDLAQLLKTTDILVRSQSKMKAAHRDLRVETRIAKALRDGWRFVS